MSLAMCLNRKCRVSVVGNWEEIIMLIGWKRLASSVLRQIEDTASWQQLSVDGSGENWMDNDERRG